MTNWRAEIVFHHPIEMDAAIAALIETGFTVGKLGWEESEEHSAGWIVVVARTELDHDDFVAFMNVAVEPFRGVVVEAGLKADCAGVGHD